MRGRRDRLAARLRGVGRAVDLEDFRGVLADARLEIERLQPEKRRDFVSRQAFAERPQPVFMQELRSDRLFGSSREMMRRQFAAA